MREAVSRVLFRFVGSGLVGLVVVAGSASGQSCTPSNTISASVVAIDQAIPINRLGTIRPDGMIYALRSDVVASNGGTNLTRGEVQLRPGKRPRPLVLRVHEGDCLKIAFQNLLSPPLQPPPPNSPPNIDSLQPVTKNASIHVTGMQTVNDITDDGTYVGMNPMSGANFSGVVPPGGTATYTLYAAARGTYLMYSTPADFNGFNSQQLTMGLFGAVNVEPPAQSGTGAR